MYFQTEWPSEIEAIFNMYRVAVFFWILVGLVWLSGVISLVTEAVKSRGRSFTDFDKSYVSKMQHTCEKVRAT